MFLICMRLLLLAMMGCAGISMGSDLVNDYQTLINYLTHMPGLIPPSLPPRSLPVALPALNYFTPHFLNEASLAFAVDLKQMFLKKDVSTKKVHLKMITGNPQVFTTSDNKKATMWQVPTMVSIHTYDGTCPALRFSHALLMQLMLAYYVGNFTSQRKNNYLLEIINSNNAFVTSANFVKTLYNNGISPAKVLGIHDSITQKDFADTVIKCFDKGSFNPTVLNEFNAIFKTQIFSNVRPITGQFNSSQPITVPSEDIIAEVLYTTIAEKVIETVKSTLESKPEGVVLIVDAIDSNVYDSDGKMIQEFNHQTSFRPPHFFVVSKKSNEWQIIIMPFATYSLFNKGYDTTNYLEVYKKLLLEPISRLL